MSSLRFGSSVLSSVVLSFGLLTAACGDRENAGTRAVTTSAPTVVEKAAPTAAAPKVDVAPVTLPVAQPAPSVAPKADATAVRETPRPKSDGKSLKVKRLVLATSVDRSSREPEGVGTAFTKGEFEKLYAFVELSNPGDESEIIVTFDPPSDKPAKGRVRLDVGSSPRWRTWATSKGLDETGEWTAIVTAPDGRVLAKETFEIL